MDLDYVDMGGPMVIHLSIQIINEQESHDQWVMSVNGFGLCGHGRSNGHKKLRFLKSEFFHQNRKIDFFH